MTECTQVVRKKECASERAEEDGAGQRCKGYADEREKNLSLCRLSLTRVGNS